MRAIIQRVNKSNLYISNVLHSSIDVGLLVLIGFESSDNHVDIEKITKKIINMRIFGDSENCGCFGDLIPMTPLQALIKNIITLVILAVIYKKSKDARDSFSKLVILFLTISTVMFAALPISSQSKSEGGGFIDFVENEEFANFEGKKILCFLGKHMVFYLKFLKIITITN